MYRLKNIINHDDEEILLSLPKCMYRLKKLIETSKENVNLSTENDIDINISQQVTKFLKAPNNKMTELEQRQDLLLKKLDILYDRIKTISSYCKVNDVQVKQVQIKKNIVNVPGEIVLVASPENLPWFLIILLAKTSLALNISWHIHSSVPNEKVPKIMDFVKHLHSSKKGSGVYLRLIFKCVSADSELKLSSLAVPIVGNVNILRYLSYIYPDVLPYNQEDFNMDGFMDLCHILERSSEKNREALINKLFSQCNSWICSNQFSVVDLAAYNVIKQWKNVPKTIPKKWFENCTKLIQ